MIQFTWTLRDICVTGKSWEEGFFVCVLDNKGDKTYLKMFNTMTRYNKEV